MQYALMGPAVADMEAAKPANARALVAGVEWVRSCLSDFCAIALLSRPDLPVCLAHEAVV